MHRVVAISVCLRSNDQFQVWSLGDPESGEREIVERFFKGIDKYTPTIVSWNGSGFDLPVLHYRALLHGINCERYWEQGGNDQSFKWNNYISRYHNRHTDLMDVLASYNPRANAPLDEIATMLGLPGKMGMSGAKVWDAYLDNNIEGIRNYCETDVLNTYLVYLRFLLMTGQLYQKEYNTELDIVRTTLEKENKPHFSQFLEAWNKNQ